MIYVGIDVAKDKHDCFITNSDGEVLFKSFTIPNNREGFETLFQKVQSVSDDLTKVKVGLEATGHYSYNLLGFLLDKGLPTYVINPLHTNLYRKSLSLRKTKTDKVDAHTIASMIMSDVNLKSYSDTSYHNEELKSLTRYRFDKVLTFLFKFHRLSGRWNLNKKVRVFSFSGRMRLSGICISCYNIKKREFLLSQYDRGDVYETNTHDRFKARNVHSQTGSHCRGADHPG